MKRISWVLCSFLLVCGFLTSVTSSQAATGPQLNVGQNIVPPPWLRGEGLKEKVADVSIGVTSSGTISPNTVLNVTYTVGIANATTIGPTSGNVICTIGAGGCPTDIAVNASGPTIAIKFPTGATLTAPGDSFRITGIRVNANALAAGGAVSAKVTPVVPTGGNGISFQIFNTTQVGLVVAQSTTVSLSEGPGSLLNCFPATASPSFTVNIEENNVASFTSAKNENDAGGCSTASTTTCDNSGKLGLLITLTNVPVGVGITPQTPTQTMPAACAPGATTGTCSQPLKVALATTGEQKGTTANGGTLTFLYIFTSSATDPGTDTTAIEAFDAPFSISTVPSTLPIGLPTPVTAAVSYSPTPGQLGSGVDDTPTFANGNTDGSVNAINLSNCVTYLLLPWVTNFNVSGSNVSSAHYDTGISIANTSTDSFVTGSALAQSGNCTLTMYPQYSGATAPPPIVYTSPTVLSGNSLTFTASTAFPGASGYVIGSCNFQNAHTFVYIIDNAGLGAPHTASDYLGLIVPNPAIQPRNPAGKGLGEILGQ